MCENIFPRLELVGAKQKNPATSQKSPLDIFQVNNQLYVYKHIHSADKSISTRSNCATL